MKKSDYGKIKTILNDELEALTIGNIPLYRIKSLARMKIKDLINDMESIEKGIIGTNSTEFNTIKSDIQKLYYR